MTRLNDVLSADGRRALSIDLAGVVHSAVADTGLHVVVMSDDADVRSWADALGSDVVRDGGAGLSQSLSSVVADLATPWAVFHADLPLLDSASVALVAREIVGGRSVLCPSLDGGTNVIGGCGTFDFSYGPGSFTRHLSMLPGARVIVDRALAIEVDTAAHYTALSTLGYTSRVAR